MTRIAYMPMISVSRFCCRLLNTGEMTDSRLGCMTMCHFDTCLIFFIILDFGAFYKCLVCVVCVQGKKVSGLDTENRAHKKQELISTLVTYRLQPVNNEIEIEF